MSNPGQPKANDDSATVDPSRIYGSLRLFVLVFFVPALLLVGFSYSFHFAIAMGLPPPAYPADLRSVVPALYEATTMRPLGLFFSLAIACFGAYGLIWLYGESLRMYRAASTAAKRFQVAAVNAVWMSLAAAFVALFGWFFLFAVPAVAAGDCARVVRLSAGHEAATCGWISHSGPIYIVLVPDAVRDLRFQRDFAAANRHGSLRRVGESETEFFLISVPAANRAGGKVRYAPVWRVPKSAVRFSSENLPGDFKTR